MREQLALFTLPPPNHIFVARDRIEIPEWMDPAEIPLIPEQVRRHRRRVASPREMARAGWTRTDPRPWGKLGARWEHVAGWTLEHCGHPTAHYPWLLVAPDGRIVRTGVMVEGHRYQRGTAWPHLASAVCAAHRIEAHGGLDVWAWMGLPSAEKIRTPRPERMEARHDAA